MPNFKKCVKIAMIKKDMDFIELSKALGVSTTAIHYALGRSNPTMDTVRKYANALGMKETELLELSE